MSVRIRVTTTIMAVSTALGLLAYSEEQFGLVFMSVTISLLTLYIEKQGEV